jgi:uncharacterized protein (TIGR02217 family)
MTYRAIRLPDCFAFGAQGGPNFVTIVATTDSGDESREGTIGKGLGRWTISYQATLADEWDEFIDFFCIVGARRDTWGFRDALDYVCTTTQSRLTQVSGSTTQWQMWKRRSVGALTYDQKIILPIANTLVVNGGGSYTLSATGGVITKVSGGNPTSFSCRFDKLCRFDIDHLQQTIESKHGVDGEFIVSYAGIPVIEVPLTSA